MSDADIWLTATRIAALQAPGVPSSEFRVRARADAEGWPSRARQGRGGGREYCVAQLPPSVQGAVRAALAARAGGIIVHPSSVGLEHRLFDAAPPAARARCLLALAVLNAVEVYLEHGCSFAEAKRRAAREARPPVSLNTVDRWWKRVDGLPRHERQVALLPQWKPGRVAEWTEAEERFYLAWRGLVVRLPRGAHRQLWRTVARDWAPADGPAPSLDRCARRWRAEAPAARRLAAQGVDVFRRESQPRPARHLRDLQVYEILNVDGYDLPWVTVLPDGSTVRATLIAIQDVKTRACVGANLAKHEGADAVLACVRDLVLRLGLPAEIRSDNGHAFSAARISGGERRHRFGAQVDEIMTGILPRLGVRWGFSLPKNPGSRPVERMFGTLGGLFESDVRLDGAFLGRSPRLRPHTYRGRHVSLEVTNAVVHDAIVAYNHETGRRGGEATGGSYLEAFEAGWRARRAAEEIRLLRADEVELFWVRRTPLAVRKNGTVVIQGAQFYDEALLDRWRERVVVCLDPRLERATEVRIESLDGAVLCYARRIAEVGFRDRDAAAQVLGAQRAIERAARAEVRRWEQEAARLTAAAAGGSAAAPLYTPLAAPEPDAPKALPAGRAPAPRRYLGDDLEAEEASERVFNQLVRPAREAGA
jgi:putative transposase